MAQKFNVGDIVQLKSGGPKMTVTLLNPERDSLHACWFAGSKKESGVFPILSLDAVANEHAI